MQAQHIVEDGDESEDGPADDSTGELPVRGFGVGGILDPEGDPEAEELVGKEDVHRQDRREEKSQEQSGPFALVGQLGAPEQRQNG